MNGAMGHISEENYSENDDRACVGDRTQNVNKQQHGSSSGDILNHEVFLDNSDESAKESEYDSSATESEDDEGLREAELQLELLKKEEKELRKQSKRARIARETAEVQKSLNELKSKNVKKKSKKITSASLRAMDEVVDQVDRLMDRHMNIKNDHVSDYESDVVSVTSSTKKRSKGSINERGGKQPDTRLVSGKSKNSLNSDVKFPQKWPHSFLNPMFVNSKEKNYEDLTISEFCAGYMTILEDEENEEKRGYRTAHLKELMYLSTRFRWKCVLDYHGACLTEIERGHLKWGQQF